MMLKSPGIVPCRIELGPDQWLIGFICLMADAPFKWYWKSVYTFYCTLNTAFTGNFLHINTHPGGKFNHPLQISLSIFTVTLSHISIFILNLNQNYRAPICCKVRPDLSCQMLEIFLHTIHIRYIVSPEYNTRFMTQVWRVTSKIPFGTRIWSNPQNYIQIPLLTESKKVSDIPLTRKIIYILLRFMKSPEHIRGHTIQTHCFTVIK